MTPSAFINQTGVAFWPIFSFTHLSVGRQKGALEEWLKEDKIYFVNQSKLLPSPIKAEFINE